MIAIHFEEWPTLGESATSSAEKLEGVCLCSTMEGDADCWREVCVDSGGVEWRSSGVAEWQSVLSPLEPLT